VAERDSVALLIPWYATGALPAEEKALVEAHLRDCAECRDLLSGAKEHAALFEDAMRADAHAHPALLVRFAEEPGSLDEETRAGIEARLARCETCRDALAIVRETEVALAAGDRPVKARGKRRSLFDFLSSTLLAPAPALAYLVLLALLVPMLFRGGGEEGMRAPALAVPTVVRVEGEKAQRSGDETLRGEPLRVEPHGDGPFLFLLDTDLATEDLDDPALSFVVEVTRAGATHAETRRGGDFTREGGKAALPLVVAAKPGEMLTFAIRAKKPGDPLDGRVLYRSRVTIGGAP
jgi:hypothetical protein